MIVIKLQIVIAKETTDAFGYRGETRNVIMYDGKVYRAHYVGNLASNYILTQAEIDKYFNDGVIIDDVEVRRMAYPDWHEQFEMLYDDGIDAPTFRAANEQVKTDIPKTSVEV